LVELVPAATGRPLVGDTARCSEDPLRAPRRLDALLATATQQRLALTLLDQLDRTSAPCSCTAFRPATPSSSSR
jgi:hypothetical protein